MNLEDIYSRYLTEQSCILLLENIIWHGVPKCPYCGSVNAVPLTFGNRYHCNTCNTSFSITVKTIFHKTKVPLQTWFYLIHLKETNALNISLRELATRVSVTKDTANRLVNKINNSYTSNTILFKTLNDKLQNA